MGASVSKKVCIYIYMCLCGGKVDLKKTENRHEMSLLLGFILRSLNVKLGSSLRATGYCYVMLMKAQLRFSQYLIVVADWPADCQNSKHLHPAVALRVVLWWWLVVLGEHRALSQP